MVRFFMNIREFTPSAKLLWKMNAVSTVKPAVNSAVVRVRKPNSTAKAAAELKKNGQRQQEPRNAHGFHILLGARITGDFSPTCHDEQNWHQNTRDQYTNIF